MPLDAMERDDWHVALVTPCATDPNSTRSHDAKAANADAAQPEARGADVSSELRVHIHDIEDATEHPRREAQRDATAGTAAHKRVQVHHV
jgi:hypothetical protein